mmetsp:Transcript_1058/g.696  ORF Transcript_1058/g.696 Transcript_1058/m.696 type:complete len:207 (-) Transcript_1058:1086-1706(-)
MGVLFGRKDSIPEEELEYEEGLKIGEYKKETGELHLYNHFVFIVKYHNTMDSTKRIVGLDVLPYSIKREKKELYSTESCRSPIDMINYEPMNLSTISNEVLFSYEVKFQESDLTWAHRSDHYYKLGNSEVHYFGLVFSSLIALGLVVATCKVLFKSLNKDFSDIKFNTSILSRRKKNRTQARYEALQGDEASSNASSKRSTEASAD